MGSFPGCYLKALQSDIAESWITKFRDIRRFLCRSDLKQREMTGFWSESRQEDQVSCCSRVVGTLASPRQEVNAARKCPSWYKWYCLLGADNGSIQPFFYFIETMGLTRLSM